MKSVAIFAYNEAENISRLLCSLSDAGLSDKDKAFVLINGCTDNTHQIVQEISRKDPRIHAIEIELGDKANAWNVYLDQLAPDNADLHVFLDGDVLPSKNAFNKMIKAFEKHTEAIAVSSLPKGGRQSEPWAKRILKFHGMPGNMYGIKKETFQRLRRQPIRLPIGLVGDDSFLRFLFLRNLDPKASETLDYIRPLSTVFFEYKSFPANTWGGLKAIWKRHLRYARRDLEHAVLVKRLQENGLSAMPRRADELWKNLPKALFLQERLTFVSLLFPIVLINACMHPHMKLKAKAWDE